MPRSARLPTIGWRTAVTHQPPVEAVAASHCRIEPYLDQEQLRCAPLLAALPAPRSALGGSLARAADLQANADRLR